ncbi:hypothetical protein ACLBWZ_16320 [Brucellaceae bacterium C25G]
MAFTIGVRIYRITIRKKGEKEALEIGPNSAPCDFIEYATDFVNRKIVPTTESDAQRTWFFEPIETNSIRTIHGYINYGTHGFESRFKDIKTKKEKYKRQSSDLEEIPLYFQIWVPSSSTFAFIAFQSFQGRSCIGHVQKSLSIDFQTIHPDYALTFKVMAPDAAIVDTAPVKSVTFLQPRKFSDSADGYFLGKKIDEYQYDVTIRAKKRGGVLSTYKDLKTLVTPDASGFVEFDGDVYEGVKADVDIGKKRRVVGIYGSGLDAGLIDVTENVTTDKSGHPIFSSIAAEVDSLMEEFFDGVKT